MSLVAVAMALSAAVLHAGWNLLLARSRDPQSALLVAMLAGVALLAPLALVLGPRVAPAAWPFIAVSSALELAYFVLLARAYERTELSLVYPISRGLAPVLVLVVGVALGAATSAAQVGGVLLVAIGVVLVRGMGTVRAAGRHVALAMLIGGLIAGYTLVDAAGIRHADPLSYLVLVVALPLSVWAPWLIRRRGLARIRLAATPPVLLGGAAVVGAYGLVLGALAIAPAAPVAALRETSVVIATVLAGTVVGEPAGRLRVAGAAVVALGVALIVTG
jgi:drug/metabolite transporter (DMT)-like permease